MLNKLSIVILAAGKGSRMKSNKAKVLHDISGKPMLYHIIKESLVISDDVIVVVAHQKDAVIKQMNSYFENITYITQNADEFPGTGGAMMGVKPKYDDVLVLNGDMPLITSDALELFLQSDSDITMSIFDLINPDGYGRVAIENSKVQYIVEQKDATSEQEEITTVNAGIYRFKTSVLKTYIPQLSNDNAQDEYYLTDIIALAKRDALSIKPLLVDEELFKGVNSKYDLAQAEIIMQNRIKEMWMKKGVTMQLPQTIYIEEGVELSGECILENGVRLAQNSIICDSHIKAYSVIEDSVITDSAIGPMAHIRPSCVIKNTHIGNFVEVKKSSLNGVKAGHLSYLGDSQIEEGTNIGAGVITCNYDGINKYKTTIGKNVFIGSDSQIVAPCVIEDNVMIAAGTTIACKKVESGVLAINRAPLKTVKNFFYKFFKK
ncbi:MAG: bifunctional UDP-N-acetylglucosamine diphosphorylase/glucosamine-1-phosphate N-acetyltransferase GlmU [Helicobacteraceae bacterium]|nr:bifunctional UDP-N-acetylglucosamine diphosphorylase/glucosamine-1-phosphate N-acetyltransferase GlmU [Helicobacteraceae bacterium]